MPCAVKNTTTSHSLGLDTVQKHEGNHMRHLLPHLKEQKASIRAVFCFTKENKKTAPCALKIAPAVLLLKNRKQEGHDTRLFLKNGM